MTHSDNYELVRITDRELIDFTRSQNGVSWRGALTLQQYIIRELVLSKANAAKKIMVFMLQDSNGNKLASIELLVRDATKYVYNGSTVERQPVECGVIGGVFTYPEYRGQGLARVMVDKLMEGAKTTIIGSSGFTFLYSEIGEYYSRNGFTSVSVPLCHIPVSSTPTTSIASNDTVTLLGYHEFKPYFELFRQRYEERIIEEVEKDHKTRISPNITLDYVDWFHLRAKYISYLLFHQEPAIDFEAASYEELVEKLSAVTPKIFGLKITQANNLVGFIVWTYDWSPAEDGSYTSTVTVIKVHVEPGYDVDDYTLRLLTHLKIYLEKQNQEGDRATSGFVKIVVWESDTSEDVRAKLQASYLAKTGIDNPSRSAILLHEPSEHQKLCDGELIWENNNKLTWF